MTESGCAPGSASAGAVTSRRRGTVPRSRTGSDTVQPSGAVSSSRVSRVGVRPSLVKVATTVDGSPEYANPSGGVTVTAGTCGPRPPSDTRYITALCGATPAATRPVDSAVSCSHRSRTA